MLHQDFDYFNTFGMAESTEIAEHAAQVELIDPGKCFRHKKQLEIITRQKYHFAGLMNSGRKR
jgi:hypothetical protein